MPRAPPPGPNASSRSSRLDSRAAVMMSATTRARRQNGQLWSGSAGSTTRAAAVLRRFEDRDLGVERAVTWPVTGRGAGRPGGGVASFLDLASCHRRSGAPPTARGRARRAPRSAMARQTGPVRFLGGLRPPSQGCAPPPPRARGRGRRVGRAGPRSRASSTSGSWRAGLLSVQQRKRLAEHAQAWPPASGDRRPRAVGAAIGGRPQHRQWYSGSMGRAAARGSLEHSPVGAG